MRAWCDVGEIFNDAIVRDNGACVYDYMPPDLDASLHDGALANDRAFAVDRIRGYDGMNAYGVDKWPWAGFGLAFAVGVISNSDDPAFSIHDARTITQNVSHYFGMTAIPNEFNHA